MQMCYGCPCTTSTFRQAASRRAGGSPGDDDGARAQQLEDDAVAEHRHRADLHANAQERRAQDLLLLPRRRVAQQSLRRFRGVLVERALICTCSDVLSLGVSRLEHNAGISVRPVLFGQSCEGRRERERRGAGSLLMTHDAGAGERSAYRQPLGFVVLGSGGALSGGVARTMSNSPFVLLTFVCTVVY